MERAAHLLALGCLVLAQPVLNLLAKTPAFFVIRRIGGPEIILLVLLLCYGIPALLIGILRCLKIRLDPRSERVATATVVAIFSGLFFLQCVHGHGWSSGALRPILAAVFAAVIGLTYFRYLIARKFFTALAPAILVVPILFLFFSPVRSQLVSPALPPLVQAQQAKAPIVMMIFDGLSVIGLLDKKGSIDARLYPNFASLAGQGTWYRNVSSRSDKTDTALPAILTGHFPDSQLLPTYSSQPRNLFAYLGDRYEMHVQEHVTTLCPENLCPPGGEDPSRTSRFALLLVDSAAVLIHQTFPHEWLSSSPPIHSAWEYFAGDFLSTYIRQQQPYEVADHFLTTLKKTTRPTLWFLHLEAPHGPFRYLPSGRAYGPLGSLMGNEYVDNSPSMEHLRYLLSIGYADQELGRILKKLRGEGLFDSSLIVLTADHGTKLQAPAGIHEDEETVLAERFAVPLFIKQPFQYDGKIVETAIETTDVFPTMAELLGSPLPWKVDGHSAVSGSMAEKSARSMRDGVNAALKIKLGIFGSNPRAFDDLFHIDDPLGLVGKKVSTFDVQSAGGYRVRLDHPELFDSVSLEGRFLPARITGTLSSPGSVSRQLSLAVSVNGVIRSLSQMSLTGVPSWFSAMVPESSFRPGKNDVRILLVRPGGKGLLEPTGQMYREFELHNGIVVGAGGRQLQVIRRRFSGRIQLQQRESELLGRGRIQTDGTVRFNRLLIFSKGELVESIARVGEVPGAREGQVVRRTARKGPAGPGGGPAGGQVDFYFSYPWVLSRDAARKDLRFFALTEEDEVSEIEWTFAS